MPGAILRRRNAYCNTGDDGSHDNDVQTYATCNPTLSTPSLMIKCWRFYYNGHLKLTINYCWVRTNLGACYLGIYLRYLPTRLGPELKLTWYTGRQASKAISSHPYSIVFVKNNTDRMISLSSRCLPDTIFLLLRGDNKTRPRGLLQRNTVDSHSA